MNVAVVGAGLAGLAVAWHLLQRGSTPTLFDARGIGGGASGFSSGLLHPFPGRRALHSWMAEEGMREAIALLEVTGHPARKGVFRPAATEQQKKDFSFRVREESCEGVEWREVPGLTDPGLWIAEGRVIFAKLYLQQLWEACRLRGAHLVEERIVDLDALESFDQIVLTAGFETLEFALCRHLPFEAKVGQALLCRWEEPLAFGLTSHGYIAPTEDPSICFVGSTYEPLETWPPNPAKAYLLLKQVARFYPPALHFEVVAVQSGVRLSRCGGGYRPICERLSPRVWVLTGLGSRGFLYHAWMAKTLVQSMVDVLCVG